MSLEINTVNGHAFAERTCYFCTVSPTFTIRYRRIFRVIGSSGPRNLGPSNFRTGFRVRHAFWARAENSRETWISLKITCELTNYF